VDAVLYFFVVGVMEEFTVAVDTKRAYWPVERVFEKGQLVSQPVRSFAADINTEGRDGVRSVVGPVGSRSIKSYSKVGF
jgi:hypothetical protein